MKEGAQGLPWKRRHSFPCFTPRRGQTWMGGYIFFCLAPQCLTCLWRPTLEEGAQVFQSANPGRDQPCGVQPGKDTGAATSAWLPMACLAHGGQPWMRGMQLPWPHSPGPNKPWGSQLWKKRHSFHGQAGAWTGQTWKSRHRPAMEEGSTSSLAWLPSA